MAELGSKPRRNYFNPHARGYHAVYHDGEVNHCPGCGRTHWLVGRTFGRVRVLLDGASAQGSCNSWPRCNASFLERHTSELRRAQRRLKQRKFRS